MSGPASAGPLEEGSPFGGGITLPGANARPGNVRRPGSPFGTGPQTPQTAQPAREPALAAQDPTPTTGTYQRMGVLTADDLLNGAPRQFDHLQEAVLTARAFVQAHYKNLNRSEEVAAARLSVERREAMAGEIDRLLVQYVAKAQGMPRGRDAAVLIALTINEVVGLGPIEPLWADPRINEIMVNGPDRVYVEINGRNVFVPGVNFRDQTHLMEVCTQIVAPLNRRIDQKSPLADGRLPDGSRVNIVHTAVGPAGPYVTIRRHTNSAMTLLDLIAKGSTTEEMARVMAWLVYHKASSVVCGGTGSGKTTLLNALSFCINPEERIVTVEDSLELRLNPAAQVLPLEARPDSAAGGDGVPIRALVKNALRMKPTRIIVGEVRDESAIDMLTAMNTGHEGSMTTVHANDAEGCISRLSTLVAMGGEIPPEQTKWLIGSACDLIIMQRRYEDGSRRIQGIYEVPAPGESGSEHLVPIPLWEWRQTGVDAVGRFLGEYQHLNDISPGMRRRLRLDQFPMFTADDLARVCRGQAPTSTQE